MLRVFIEKSFLTGVESRGGFQAQLLGGLYGAGFILRRATAEQQQFGQAVKVGGVAWAEFATARLRNKQGSAIQGERSRKQAVTVASGGGQKPHNLMTGL
jgi:hypothetical protein